MSQMAEFYDTRYISWSRGMTNVSVPEGNMLKNSSTLIPGFSNVRYRFYSDIDRLTAVLALHERKIAHPFDKCLLT